MPKTVSFVLCCCVFQGMFAQAPNAIGNIPLVTLTQANPDEGQPNLLEKFKDKDKFTCVLNILKTALSEEIENAQCVLEDSAQETVLNNLNSLLEEGRLEDESEVQNLRNTNETKAEKALYKTFMKKIATALTKPTKNNNTTDHPINNNQINNNYQTNNNNGIVEMPSMIPIFRPRSLHPMPRNEPIQNNDCRPSRPKSKPKPVHFVPEKIVQTNLNLIPKAPMFNIPCQRAADVLDMTNAVPDVCGNIELKTLANLNPVAQEIVPILPNPPVTLSVNCADTEDTVAVLFKPKAISLMQVYGNLLKNITITVLVPYHMSKLALD